jgi:choline dehydrogenase
MMGNHAMSVVDSALWVHGLDALRVVDASIVPAVSSTNTNAPTIMITEKRADMVLATARQRLAALPPARRRPMSRRSTSPRRQESPAT